MFPPASSDGAAFPASSKMSAVPLLVATKARVLAGAHAGYVSMEPSKPKAGAARCGLPALAVATYSLVTSLSRYAYASFCPSGERAGVVSSRGVVVRRVAVPPLSGMLHRSALPVR